MRRALLVANGVFDDARITSLNSPIADSEALSELLRAPDIGGFTVDFVREASAREIRLAIERCFRDATKDDVVLLYMTGHGATSSGGFVYVPADADSDWLESTCVGGTFIKDLMAASRASQQIIVLDCCFSGSFARHLLAKSAGTIALSGLRAEGRVVIASSSAIQESFEFRSGDGWTSIFTRSLVEGISSGTADEDGDGIITLRELYGHAHRCVTSQLSTQTPTITEIEVLGDLPIATVPLRLVSHDRMPPDLELALTSPYGSIRLAAVQEIGRFLHSSVDDRVRTARRVLREIAVGEDPRLARMADELLRIRRRPRRRGGAQSASTGEAPTGEMWFSAEPKDFFRAVGSVVGAASTDPYRPIYQGALIEVQDGTLELTATDSYRIATTRLRVDGNDGAALVDASQLGSVRPQKGRLLIIYLGDKVIELQVAKFVAAVDRIDGLYPNYRTLIVPPLYDCKVNTKETILAVEYVNRNSDPLRPVSLQFSSDKLLISGVGESASTRAVQAQSEVDDLVVGVNPAYLLDGLTGSRSELVHLSPYDELRPLHLWSDEWDFTYLLMPVRLSAWVS